MIVVTKVQRILEVKSILRSYTKKKNRDKSDDITGGCFIKKLMGFVT